MNNQNKKLWLIIGLLGGLIVCLIVVLILYFGYVKPGSSDADQQTASAASQTAAAEATKQAFGTSTKRKIPIRQFHRLLQPRLVFKQRLH